MNQYCLKVKFPLSLGELGWVLWIQFNIIHTHTHMHTVLAAVRLSIPEILIKDSFFACSLQDEEGEVDCGSRRHFKMGNQPSSTMTYAS